MSGTVLLDAVAAADAVVRRGEVDRLEAVLAWAHAHPAGRDDTAASWAVNRSMFTPELEGEDRLGGEGTPPVADFAVEQLATRLGISSGAAMQLVADTLNLAHRHPTLWAHVRAGGCPTWTARRIAQTCGSLPSEASLLAEGLGETDLRIRPVLDTSAQRLRRRVLRRADTVDAHDSPEWMRELVIQRDRHCVFPSCDRDARSCDLGHLEPSVPLDQGGPPGQTGPAKPGAALPAASPLQDLHPVALPPPPGRRLRTPARRLRRRVLDQPSRGPLHHGRVTRSRYRCADPVGRIG